ncbi:hypothetical protein ACM46_22130 [Chryseobacterium angstadtii]|uniref:Beta-lactamase n=1 Tax=Chryseobacterium angstadtii TaxID=558151 RepID=A0A0J7HWB7_9FLAO|nr:serine hydrolase domain-containing protein [Chryseobacterium angstadtii]KMQ58407.1 hypothetical protein ACM46_22130 [Chryseobacterium angstadtii]
MKNTSLIIISLLSVFCSAQNSFKRDINLKSIVDNAANKMIEKPLINAVSIGIVYNGQEFIGHYGELEKGKSNAPTDQTVYEIGSLSKTMTGTLVAKAVLEKKMNLEDPVQKYLSEDYPNLKFNGHPVRIKDLVTHTSGLPNMLPLDINEIFKDFANEKMPESVNMALKNYKQKDFLRDLHAVKIDTIPGYKYSYSSAGIELLASALEKAYHKKFEVLLKDYLSGTIKMNHSELNLPKKEEENLAVGYHIENQTIAPRSPQLPWGSSANVKTTLPDMVKYIRYQLKNNAEIQESHRSLIKLKNGTNSGYAWRIFKDDKLGIFYRHHGGIYRSQCFIYIIPEHHLGVFIITNQSGKNTPKDMQDMLGEIFKNISG